MKTNRPIGFRIKKTSLLIAIFIALFIALFSTNPAQLQAQSAFETFTKTATIIDVDGDGCFGGVGDEIRYEIAIILPVDAYDATFFDIVDPATTISQGPVSNPPPTDDRSDNLVVEIDFFGFQGGLQTFVYTTTINTEAASYTNQGTLTDLQIPPNFEIFSDDPSTSAAADPTVATASGCATYVDLASFAVEETAVGNEVRWVTAAEIDNVGFNLYRGPSADGPWTKINETLIPALGNPLDEQQYAYTDANGSAESVYMLEDIDVSGTRTQYIQPAHRVTQSSREEREFKIFLSLMQ